MTKKSKVILSLAIILLTGLTIGGIYAYKYYNYIFGSNVNLGMQETAYLYIPTGASYQNLKDILEEGDYLDCLESFDFVSERKNYPARLSPGRYKLEHGMSNNDLVDLLRSGKQEPLNLSFISFRTKEILAGRIAQFIEADSLELINLFNDPEIHSKYGFNEFTFVSMFIPNTYQFYWNTSGEEFLERMAQEYRRFWNEDRRRKAQNIGLSQSEVSTLASIVEAETTKNDEKARIAGVYINRLNRGWKLQADPTVVFAWGDFSIRRVLYKHLEIDSPYNTYKYEGLPPGPINLPSIASIDAVLNYENHSYMFFSAKEDFSGYHNFAVNLRQHNINAAKYHRALRDANIFR